MLILGVVVDAGFFVDTGVLPTAGVIVDVRFTIDAEDYLLFIPGVTIDLECFC